jgi:hypothetical protein
VSTGEPRPWRTRRARPAHYQGLDATPAEAGDGAVARRIDGDDEEVGGDQQEGEGHDRDDVSPELRYHQLHARPHSIAQDAVHGSRRLRPPTASGTTFKWAGRPS